ncbi:MAG: zinc ribbon domain-containing protein [Armatimonadetes bacterium]|nr:zinc ribbon domain-containing protein [Armatimonadota bacterium]
MPIYEFKCSHCNNKFEEICASDLEIKDLTCPNCGNKELKRLISLFSSSRGSLTQGENFGDSGSSCSSCASRQCSTCS